MPFSWALHQFSSNGQNIAPFLGRCIKSTPNGQNKCPFLGRSHHNLYRRTPNHAFRVRHHIFAMFRTPNSPFRVRDLPNGPNSAGTKRAEQPLGCAESPALSGRPAYLPTAVTSQTNSPTALPHKTSGQHTITLQSHPNPNHQIKNQSAVSSFWTKVARHYTKTGL